VSSSSQALEADDPIAADASGSDVQRAALSHLNVDLGFGWLASQPASKPVGHTRHSSHAGHAATTAKVA